MREEYNADISGQEIELLVDYHVERQRHEAVIFNEKARNASRGRFFWSRI
jgi:hypothetical protein